MMDSSRTGYGKEEDEEVPLFLYEPIMESALSATGMKHIFAHMTCARVCETYFAGNVSVWRKSTQGAGGGLLVSSERGASRQTRAGEFYVSAVDS